MIDPSIPLAYKPPQFNDPLEQQGKILNLMAARQQIQNAPLHTQALQQQVQAGALENEQRKQAVADDAAGRQLFAGIQAGGTMPADAEILAKLGPTHGSAIVKSLREADKAHADLQKTRGEVAAQEQDYAGGLAAMVKAAGYSPEAVQLAIQHAHQAGYEQQAQQLLPLLQPENQAKIQPLMDSLIQQSPGQQKLVNEGKTAHGAEQRGQAAADASQRDSALQPFKINEAQSKNDQIQREKAARENPTDPALQQAALTAKDRADKAQKDREFYEQNRHNLSQESTARLTAAVSQGRLAQEQMVNGMKYGPGTTEYWVKQLQDSPDSIKEMPAELRSNVGKAFSQTTGLPLPTPAGEAAKTQETAARNALEGAAFIQNALKNPEIRANLGPIMGRLGNAEQALGTAPNLSPEASKVAQELRTRLRYFIFQEGKAVMGGRLPAQLMKQLEESSPNPKMDPDMLAGALQGAIGNATTVMDNVERQRFGGKMRPGAMRSGPAAPAKLPTGHSVGDVVNVKGQNIKITAVHPDGSFDGDPVSK